MKSTLSNNDKTLLLFLIKIASLYLFWYVCYEFYLKTDGRLDQIITRNISEGIIHLMQFTGLDFYYTNARKIGETYLFIAGQLKPLVRIGSSCNGLEPIILFAIFIIAYPGKLTHKLWFIPAGVIVIHLVNIIRNYVLTLMVYYKMPSFDFFHRYVFVILVYLLIFGFWMLWVNKFSLKGLKSNDDNREK